MVNGGGGGGGRTAGRGGRQRRDLASGRSRRGGLTMHGIFKRATEEATDDRAARGGPPGGRGGFDARASPRRRTTRSQQLGDRLSAASSRARGIAVARASLRATRLWVKETRARVDFGFGSRVSDRMCAWLVSKPGWASKRSMKPVDRDRAAIVRVAYILNKSYLETTPAPTPRGRSLRIPSLFARLPTTPRPRRRPPLSSRTTSTPA